MLWYWGVAAAGESAADFSGGPRDAHGKLRAASIKSGKGEAGNKAAQTANQRMDLRSRSSRRNLGKRSVHQAHLPVAGEDIRISHCEISPEGLVEWSFNVGMRGTCPAILAKARDCAVEARQAARCRGKQDGQRSDFCSRWWSVQNSRFKVPTCMLHK